MPKCLLATLTLLGCPAVVAQNTATVPPICETLPGNAAFSMPLRWSEGTLQVFIDPELLPSGFVGETITGLRLRRSVLPGAVAYPAMTRTLTVRGAFQMPPAVNMIGMLMQNRPPNEQVLFGPAQISVPATPAPGPATTIGEQFVQIVFSQSLPVTAGTLYLEFEAGDPPLQVLTDNWVDAVWFDEGLDEGMVVAVGDGSCTTRTEPTRLRWTSAEGPLAGTTAELEVIGAPPAGFALVWVGLDPETVGPSAIYTGYGGSFGAVDPGMVDCHMWAPLDVAWFGPTDTTGTFATTFEIPGAVAIGQRLALQAGWLDFSRPVVPLSFSNGLQLVCRSAGVDDHCSSFFFPGQAETSPWGPLRGQMPVIVLDY